MRLLNLGAGRFPAPPPWVNVDVLPAWGDVVADVRALPFADGSAIAVYAGHVAEHLDLGDLNGFLRDVRRILKPGGALVAVIPDIDLGRSLIETGQAPPSLMDEILAGPDYGEGKWERHKWPPRLSTLRREVDRHFDVVRQIALGTLTATGWPLVSEARWQAALIAT